MTEIKLYNQLDLGAKDKKKPRYEIETVKDGFKPSSRDWKVVKTF